MRSAFQTRFFACRFVVCAFITFNFSACGHEPASQLDGLSASGSAHNKAVLVQGNLPEAANDIALVKTALNDATAHYGFDVATRLNSSIGGAVQSIGSASSGVDPEGTLFVYLGGHGSPDGGSQMADGQLLYYSQIRQALAANVHAPIKRLVLMVFGCYSGSWINNIHNSLTVPQRLEELAQQSAKQAIEEFSSHGNSSLYQQLIVITSSGSNELSYYTPGGESQLADAFAATFRALHSRTTPPVINDLLQGIRSRVPSSTVAFEVSPQSVLSETLFNP